MKRMLRAAALLIAAALLSPCASALSACRAAVLDADTGEVCFARNASEHALIASTTKIMTGLLITEDCDPDAVVTVPQEAVGIEGSSLYLKAGEQLTVRALLYGLLLHSGNDAAVALALAHSGSVGAFVEAMNGRARELGLRDTHFTNPNGLDAPEHYSTALDLARLTRAALQVPAFAEVVATRQITIEGRSFTNHNRLLWSLDGAIGVKTGYTRAAGRTLVSAVERNGRRLIAVTLCAPDDWQDHACLYDEAFAAFSEREVRRKRCAYGRGVRHLCAARRGNRYRAAALAACGLFCRNARRTRRRGRRISRDALHRAHPAALGRVYR